jgi:pimeloyl-ACP methyl ester carboxylesterase
MTNKTTQQEYIKIEEGTVHMVFRWEGNSRPTLLFVHGLGESGLSFRESLRKEYLMHINMIVPDLLGCGRSSCARSGKYSLALHCKSLISVLKYFNVDTNEVILVGHSMGADTAILLAKDYKFKGLVHIEGNITGDDLFITSQARNAVELGRFSEWFNTDFCEQLVYNSWGKERQSAKRYYASLMFCDQIAFAQNAVEMYERNMGTVLGDPGEFGKIFIRLNLPMSHFPKVCQSGRQATLVRLSL